MRPHPRLVERRMAENPGMDELTAYRAEQSLIWARERFNRECNRHRERIYAKW